MTLSRDSHPGSEVVTLSRCTRRRWAAPSSVKMKISGAQGASVSGSSPVTLHACAQKHARIEAPSRHVRLAASCNMCATVAEPCARERAPSVDCVPLPRFNIWLANGCGRRAQTQSQIWRPVTLHTNTTHLLVLIPFGQRAHKIFDLYRHFRRVDVVIHRVHMKACRLESRFCTCLIDVRYLTYGRRARVACTQDESICSSMTGFTIQADCLTNRLSDSKSTGIVKGRQRL